MNKELIVLHYPVKRSTLAFHLGLTATTFNKRLRELAIAPRRTLTPVEISRIVKEFGMPSWVKIDI